MSIRTADLDDYSFLKQYDKHISETELKKSISSGHIFVVEENDNLIGWLRYNYFWDNIPFMNLLYLQDEYRGKGYGRKLVEHWEKEMKGLGFNVVMTSTQSNEYAQHFYVKLGYSAIGGFLIGKDPYELILSKEI